MKYNIEYDYHADFPIDNSFYGYIGLYKRDKNEKECDILLALIPIGDFEQINGADNDT